MRRSAIVFLMVSAVFASGCTGNSSKGTAADHSVACSSLGLSVAHADGSSAQIVNIGSNSFGNITVTWNFANGGKLSKEFNMPDAGTTEVVKSGSSGTIKGVMAIHNDCPSVTGSY